MDLIEDPGNLFHADEQGLSALALDATNSIFESVTAGLNVLSALGSGMTAIAVGTSGEPSSILITFIECLRATHFPIKL